MIDRRVATAGLLREFHRTHPDVELDLVTLFGVEEAVAAVECGTLDGFVAGTGLTLDEPASL